MAIKAILFDKDGTLLDFAATYGCATAKVIDDLAAGDPDHVSRLAAAWGFDHQHLHFGPGAVVVAGSLDDIASAAAPALERNSDTELATEIDLLYRRHTATAVTLLPCVVQVLDALQERGIVLGIATNDTEETARTHIETLGLSDRFAFIAGSDSGFGAKPDPGMVSAFVQQSGQKPGEVAMVGDSIHDLIAARSAGVCAVAVLTGLASRADLALYADHVMPALDGLFQLLPTADQ